MAKEKTTPQLQAELDELLQWFEAGNLDIDEAVKKYEHGLDLIKTISARLQTAENKVTKLAENFAAVDATA